MWATEGVWALLECVFEDILMCVVLLLFRSCFAASAFTTTYLSGSPACLATPLPACRERNEPEQKRNKHDRGAACTK
jgi:hypothetical protein